MCCLGPRSAALRFKHSRTGDATATVATPELATSGCAPEKALVVRVIGVDDKEEGLHVG